MKASDRVDSLVRGLQLLETAVSLGGGTAAALAAATGLTRSTVYRIADTLAGEGFLARRGRRYAPTLETRALSEGYVEPAWIAAHAVAPIRRLGRQIGWPISLSTFAGSHMLVRFSTDDESPYVFRPMPAGTRTTVTASAGGRLHLAYAAPVVVEQALALAAAESSVLGALPFDRAAILAELPAIRARGHYSLHRYDRGFYFLAVPILGPGGMLGSLTVRIIASAMRLATAEARYLPSLKEAAAAVGVAASGSSGAVAAS